MITPEEKILRTDLQKMLTRQGFKNSIIYTEVEGKGPGFLVALVDPVEPNSVSSAASIRWMK